MNTNLAEIAAVITKARPGTSAHEVTSLEGTPSSLATDLIPVDGAGVEPWMVTVVVAR